MNRRPRPAAGVRAGTPHRLSPENSRRTRIAASSSTPASARRSPWPPRDDGRPTPAAANRTDQKAPSPHGPGVRAPAHHPQNQAQADGPAAGPGRRGLGHMCARRWGAVGGAAGFAPVASPAETADPPPRARGGWGGSWQHPMRAAVRGSQHRRGGDSSADRLKRDNHEIGSRGNNGRMNIYATFRYYRSLPCA